MLQVAFAALCSTRSILLFSGFKIHRRYAISFFPLHIEHSVVLTKCKKGEPVFSTSIPLNSTADEFSVPFCTQDPVISTATPRSIKWHLQKIEEIFPKLNRFGIFQRLHKSGAFAFIRTLLADRRFGKIFPWYDDAALDVDAHQCFYMARRKRYAQSNLVLFLPTTFVGVLFMGEPGGAGGLYTAQAGGGARCIDGNQGRVSDSKLATKPAEEYTRGLPSPAVRPLLQPPPHTEPPENKRDSQSLEDKQIQRRQIQKQQETQTKTAPDSYSFENVRQDPKALPLCPLVADDYATHWISLQLSQAKLIYHVPYLKSPSYWDPRFPKEAPDEYPESWSQDVRFGETYSYSQSEQAVVSAALAAALETMYSRLSSIRPRVSRIMMHKLTMLAKLDTDLVLALFLSSAEKSESLQVVQMLQDQWEKESFSDGPE